VDVSGMEWVQVGWIGFEWDGMIWSGMEWVQVGWHGFNCLRWKDWSGMKWSEMK
jgi:hypothetical protein